MNTPTAHWWEGEYVSRDNRGLYIEWHDGERMRLPEKWFPTLRQGEAFRCRVWLDDTGAVRGVEAVVLLGDTNRPAGRYKMRHYPKW